MEVLGNVSQKQSGNIIVLDNCTGILLELNNLGMVLVLSYGHIYTLVPGTNHQTGFSLISWGKLKFKKRNKNKK